MSPLSVITLVYSSTSSPKAATFYFNCVIYNRGGSYYNTNQFYYEYIRLYFTSAVNFGLM